MKRISTSILMLLMLTFSVHPVLSLHFCGDELQSLHIGVLNKSSMCCMLEEIDDSQNARFSTLELGESENCCCTTTNIEVVTDNFTQNSAQSIDLPTLSTYMPAWFVVNYLFNLTTQDTTTESNFNFPIYGSYLKTLAFLSLICVYRL